MLKSLFSLTSSFCRWGRQMSGLRVQVELEAKWDYDLSYNSQCKVLLLPEGCSSTLSNLRVDSMARPKTVLPSHLSKLRNRQWENLLNGWFLKNHICKKEQLGIGKNRSHERRKLLAIEDSEEQDHFTSNHPAFATSPQQRRPSIISQEVKSAVTHHKNKAGAKI